MACVQITVAMLSGNSLRQTVHTHRASVYLAAKLVAALLRVARVTAGLVESNGSLPPGLWLTSPAGWLPRTGISSGTLHSVVKYGLPLPFLCFNAAHSGVQSKRPPCWHCQVKTVVMHCELNLAVCFNCGDTVQSISELHKNAQQPYGFCMHMHDTRCY